MIALDTNVLVRYVERDDPTQTALADELLGLLTPREPGFITTTTAVELWWVLRRSYGRAKKDMLRLFHDLLETDELIFEDSRLVRTALETSATSADFADALIVAAARTHRCSHIASFDQGAIKHAGMTAVTDVLAANAPTIIAR